MKNQMNFGSLIDFIDKSNIPYFIRDNESKFLYANKAGLCFLNIPPEVNIEGKFDVDLPVDWVKFTGEFQQQDRITEDSGRATSVISTQLYNFKKQIEPYLCPKSPLYSGNDCIGTVGWANRLKFISMPNFVDTKKPFVLSPEPPNNLFSQRELDIIFFIQQRLSSKEIARRLKLSPKTVENKLQFIYQKVDVHSTIQFIEYCKQTGFDKYIPLRLMRKGVQLIN